MTTPTHWCGNGCPHVRPHPVLTNFEYKRPFGIRVKPLCNVSFTVLIVPKNEIQQLKTIHQIIRQEKSLNKTGLCCMGFQKDMQTPDIFIDIFYFKIY